MTFCAKSKILASEILALEETNWIAGALEASKVSKKGGVMPGGGSLRTIRETAGDVFRK